DAGLLQWADTIPPVVPEALQAWLRGIPGVKQDNRRLTLALIPRRAEELQGQGVRGSAPRVPPPAGERHTPRAVRPDQEEHRHPKEDRAVLMRPHPRRYLFNNLGHG